ncbi:MAG: AbgT family transporter [Myxococcota bacterium]
MEVLRADGHPGRPVDGGPSASVRLRLLGAARSSRLVNLYVELRRPDGELVAAKKVNRAELADLDVNSTYLPELSQPGHYRLHVVERSVEVRPRSVLSGDGLRWWVLHLVESFAHFEPLGIVLVMLMGVSVAEGAGLVTAVMRGVALAVPSRWVTPVLFALAACGNIGSDAGVVVMPPLAAAIYRTLGKSPILGLFVGYVGATAGFTANLLPAGTDVLAMSLTNAATGGSPEIGVLANWYFMVASVVFLSVLGTLVTHRVVEPRLGSAISPAGDTEPPGGPEQLNPQEKRGVAFGLGAVALLLALWLLALLPEGAPLRHPDPDPALFWRSPFFKGLVPILFTLFVVGGTAYGLVVGTISKLDDILGFMSDAMRRMGPYIVLVLAISQFSAVFKYTQIDRLVAVGGADLLGALGMEEAPIPFFVAFIVAIAVANLFMGSASAKWAIFAPIFVPMFMRLGYHPAFTQLLYRVGDSITNCVSPLYPFFPLLLGWVAEEDPEKARVGTVLSYLVPYAAVLLVGWVVMTILWYLAGLPVGPASPIRL